MATNKTPKKATIEDVLVVIGELSDMVSARFDAQDSKLAAHDTRFDAQDARFDKLEQDINKIYNILDSHLKRIKRSCRKTSCAINSKPVWSNGFSR